MTKEEKIAWRHWSTVYKIESSDSSDKQKEGRKKLSIQKGWMTNDQNILKLLENGIDDFERIVVERIDSTYSIEYNICPKCERLTRTPKAKQCRFCKYDWH